LKPYQLAALLVLLLVPQAAAFHTLDPDAGGVHVLQYRAFVITHTGTTGQVPSTVVEVDQPHTWGFVAGESVLEIRGAYQVQGSSITNPVAEFRAVWNGTALTSCVWRIEGGTLGTGARSNPTLSVFCDLPAYVDPGNYTIQIERTTVTGTPITHALTSVILHQRESVEMNLDINTAIDPYLVGLIWLLLTIFFLTRAAWFPGVVTFMMMGNFFLEPPVFGLPFAFMLTLLAVFLHWMAVNGIFPGRKEAGGEQ
jgi:hypothetical protein